ncbi:MAG: DUF4349 domain-containing protein [Clostridia bacterium]|nr:DUF4349 domain-containing protein [Clostridia bacterium]
MKKMKKHQFLKAVAASAMILALMTSCGASDYSKSSEAYAADRYTEEGISVNRSADSFEAETEEYLDDIDNSGAAKGQTSGEKPAAYEDKIIRTADITIESGDAQKCYDTLLAFAKDNGGKEISVSKSTDTYGNYDYIYINAELKITPDKLNDFIALAEKTDKVTSSEVSSNDVTQQYYDIKLRLETKKEALKSYYKLLKEATTIEEALEVQRYITDLTAEIESMEGMLKYYDSKVDLSTIHLSIRQQVKLHAGAEDDFEWDSLSFSDFITLIKNGFLSVLNFLWSLLLWIIIIVIAISPLLLIAGIVIFFVRRYRKKHPKQPKAGKQNRPAVAQNYMPVYYPQGNLPQNPPAAPAAPAQKKTDSAEKADK